MTVPAPIVWDTGEAGAVVAIDGENVVVRSAKPSAPGSRPIGALADGAAVRVKVHKCRREDTGDGLVFTLEGRLLDATRGLRATLERMLATPAAPTDPM